MRSKIAKHILDETPEEVRIFVRKHSDIVVRVYQILKDKGWTQKDLARKLGKTPSEISKWLSGRHNFTLKSIAKLEAELGSEIVYIPRRDSFHIQLNGSLKSCVAKPEPVSTHVPFRGNTGTAKPTSNPDQPIAA